MLKVVIVEDEILMRTGLEIILAKAGRKYQVIGSYADGAEAVEKLLNSDADVVMTDIRMPRMDGLALVKKLHDLEIKIPSIIISGYNDFEYARAALRYGVDDFLLKPVDPEELFKCLDRIHSMKYGAIEGQGLENENENTRIVREVKKIIENEYVRELAVTDIAKSVYLHPNYLSRLFKKETGISMTDYLIYVRMSKAKELLRGSLDLKIYEVASKVGYSDSVFFTKLFRRIVGKTPKEYRDHSG